MKNRRIFLFFFLLVFVTSVTAASETTIRISTNKTDLILKTSPEGRLYQCYLGTKLLCETDLDLLTYSVGRLASDGSVVARGWEVYPVSGTEDFFEPAFAVQHNDGNLTSVLYYLSHEVKNIDGNVQETVIKLRDDQYPVEVDLHYVTYNRENIIKSWSVISHQEKKPVILSQYASSMLYFESPAYYLNEFSGDWGKEMQLSSQELKFGKKIIDTKLGTRAAMYAYPFFQLGIGSPVAEDNGKVLMGTIGWTGNFRFTFEIDNAGNLRVISGINPYASNYELKRNESFVTPEFIFTFSEEGAGVASRNFHDWAREYQLKDGKGDRLTLLNNWETTGYNFDGESLKGLMGEAKDLGVDMFLLDDGWFANKYPRENDRAGLGDWEVTHEKLPDGIPGLLKSAQEAGVKFGIWIEPEMVNPKSELYEKHPDWVIQRPDRTPYYYRNQLVLDLSNPKVQDFVFGVVDGLLTENPDIAYFKWDCNSPLTNIYSPYLKEKQNNLYIDHVRGVHNVFRRVNEKYPNVPMMLCSGGGARCDYEAMKYFTEFWCSDNTDPVERLYIQWGFSYFFPLKAMSAHVTSWNKAASIKFRTDVAMMCKLGFDISLNTLTQQEREFCELAVRNYDRLKQLISEGDFYRLISPYQSNHTAVMHIDKSKSKAVLYAYDIHPRFKEKLFFVKLQGLDPLKKYEVREINLMPGADSGLPENNKVLSGDYLMKVGLDVFTDNQMHSRVVELTEVL